MYPKPRSLEIIHAIREEMSREADYDVELFAQMVRSNETPRFGAERNIRGFKSRAPRATSDDATTSNDAIDNASRQTVTRRED